MAKGPATIQSLACARRLFTDRLLSLGLGYPLWDPTHACGKEITLGQVGWFEDGKLYELFNAMEEPVVLTKGIVSPPSYPAFIRPRQRAKPPPPLVTIRENCLEQQILSSPGIERRGQKRNEHVLPIIDSKVTIDLWCEAVSGAVMVLSDLGERRTIFSGRGIEQYMIKSYSQWLKFANTDIGLALPRDGILLVSGIISAEGRCAMSFAGSPTDSKLHIDWDVDRHSIHIQLAEKEFFPHWYNHRWSKEKGKRDQPAFIQYYKMRKRLFWLFPMRAQGGPHQLPRSPDDPGDCGLIASSPLSGEESRKAVETGDPVDYLLDYIFMNSSAEFAIASTHDITALFEGSAALKGRLEEGTVSIPELLERCSPTIHLDERNVGTLILTHKSDMREEAPADARAVSHDIAASPSLMRFWKPQSPKFTPKASGFWVFRPFDTVAHYVDRPFRRYWDIYARHMFMLGFGWPLWHPTLRSGGEICVGHLLWQESGCFSAVCNTADDSRQVSTDVPAFELKPSVMKSDSESVTEETLCSPTLCRSAEDIGKGITTGIQFQCLQRSGAILHLQLPAVSASIVARRHIMTYMWKHLDRWLRFAADTGLPCTRASDLYFISGTTKTAACSAVVFTHISSDEVISVFKNPESQELQVVLDADRKSRYFLQTSGTPGPSGGEREGAPESPAQTVFIHYYKAKRRFGLLNVPVRGAAGPHDFPYHPDRDARLGGVTARALGSSAPSVERLTMEYDPVDILLDHILKGTRKSTRSNATPRVTTRACATERVVNAFTTRA
ncbi:hypothetical protein C8Q80DRAFT_1192997 [Daedaleopsis nitida]|nr:hypothetical protein C8Q80DRAFT_1192997 [Daedaleopsis nitida]